MKKYFWLNFFKQKQVLLLFVILMSFASCKQAAKKQVVVDSPWEKMVEIVKQVKEPVFKDKVYSVIEFDAVGDGVTKNTEAFKAAIAECSKNGGGVVLVPAGKYLTGPIHLEDNVNLHVEDGAEILFSQNPQDYYPLVLTSYEGVELMNYSPLIYAKDKKNIAITGKGVLNGQADNEHWWPWAGKEEYGWKEGTPKQKDSLGVPKLMDVSDRGIPVEERVFGNDHYLRPTFLEPFNCENVLIQGVTIINAPFWVIHPTRSNNVIVDGVTVNSHGPNNDGCDPEYSKNVIIKNCVFNTGDDCIAIKAGRDADGRRVGIKSENIIVQNCKMIDGHGGVVIGSEMSAGVSNVFVEGCVMNSANLDRAIRIKTNTKRGGVVDGVYVRDLEVGQVKEAVLKLNMHYAVYGSQKGSFMPTIKNVELKNIRVKDGGAYGILAKGYEESPIKNILLEDVIIEKVDKAYSLDHVSNIKLIDTYINGSLMQSPE
ncbi:glycoside hydrolase family 28 protein [Wenyingzhuangia sp. IMCC45467]